MLGVRIGLLRLREQLVEHLGRDVGAGLGQRTKRGLFVVGLPVDQREPQLRARRAHLPELGVLGEADLLGVDDLLVVARVLREGLPERGDDGLVFFRDVGFFAGNLARV